MNEFAPDSDQGNAFNSILASNTDNDSLITGEAGSGKSYLTRALREAQPQGAILTATTGQAAQIIGGRTIHSFIGLIPHKGLVSPRAVEERIYNCTRLYVDEISMLSDINFGYLIDRFDQLNHYPQLVLIGDFLQLPPVNKDDDERVNHRFAFFAKQWQNAGIKVLKLTQQHRQLDPNFIGALNDIRVGKFTGRVVNLITSRKVQKLPEDCTMLFPLRSMVKEINEKHVLGLAGGLSYFKGDFWQEPDSNRTIDKTRFRFAEGLNLKPGSRIVMLNNDPERLGGRWVNGSTGQIHSVTKTEIKVVLDNGYEGNVERVLEEYYDGDGKVIATMMQFPLMLAKAMTVHKAQGMSLDRVGIGMEHHFEAGMTYVALSRARTREGLFLCGTTSRIRTHPDAIKFYQDN